MEYILQKSFNRSPYSLITLGKYYESIHSKMLKIYGHMENSSPRTFALAIDLLCAFMTEVEKSIQKKQASINHSKCYATGAVCLFIASKFEDIYPICIDHLMILHTRYNSKRGRADRLDVDYIVQIEKCVLQILDFNISRVVFLDFDRDIKVANEQIFTITGNLHLCELQPHIQFAVSKGKKDIIGLIDMSQEEFKEDIIGSE